MRFEELEVWRRSIRLSGDVYKAMETISDFGFRDQITRSGLSIPSNIAEGYERESRKEIASFLNYAKGSAGELRTQIYIGMDVGYISREMGTYWLKESEEISRMLHSLIQAVRSREQKQVQGARYKLQGTSKPR
jgi:four helix bundle protein